MNTKRILPIASLLLLLPTAALAQTVDGDSADVAADENNAALSGHEVEVETLAAARETHADPRALEAPKESEGPSFWSPAIDTRLTFVLADDNLLAAPGESDEPSPGPQLFADDSNNLFFESYDTKDSGFDNLTHLVLYKESPTFFKGLTGTAALVLRLDVDPTDTRGATFRVRDSSSYVRMRYQPEGWGDRESVSFTGFPVSSDRFLLGYSYRLTWGGSRTFIKATKVPGARVQVTRDHWYAWLGGKTAVLDETIPLGTEQNTEKVANYGGLGGFGIDLLDTLRLEGGGGYYTRGTFAREAVRGEKRWAGGVSTQLAWHVGRDVGTSIDLRLYQNDPEQDENIAYFRPVNYDDGVDWVLKSEFTYLLQNLEDFENYGSTVAQRAIASDINFAMRMKRHRFFVDLVYQDLSFILFNVPSLVPSQSYSNDMEVHPEWFALVAWDYHLPDWHLTPGVRLGIQSPAYAEVVTTNAGINPPDNLTGRRALVIKRAGEFSILPVGQTPVPIFALQGTAKLDISESLSALGEVSFELDNNRTTFRESTTGETVAVFLNPYLLSFNFVLQARF